MAAGLRARVVTPDAAKLTRQMNQLGRQARPVFREAAEQVAGIAAKELKAQANSFSRQTRSLAGSIEAKRDRVPYVAVRRGGVYRRAKSGRKRDAVRAGDIALGSEYGSRSRPVFVAPSHGGQSQGWKAGGYWWGPTIRDGAKRWERMWLDALDKILDKASR